MTLRTKTFAVIGSALIALVVILYGISQSVVQGGFRKVETDLAAGFAQIENRDADRNVQRVVDALGFRIENLSLKAADWSQWDDTYKFIVDDNKAYRESNLTKDALSALKINLILLVDTSGKVVFGTAFDLENGTEVAVPQSLKAYLAPQSLLTKHSSPESVVEGLLLLPENPLMIVSRPIVTSEAAGPIRGSLIFGRFLDDAEFERLSTITHLSIQRHRVDAASTPADVRGALDEFSPRKPILVRALNTDTMAGYTTVSDLARKPALVLRVDIPREIHRQSVATQEAIRSRGRVVLASLVGSICAAGLVLGGLILWILESSVLSRVARLSTKAVHIGASEDFAGRVSAEGKDEISTLAGSINTMLEALGASHGIIRERNAEVSLLMDTVPAGLLSLDEEFRVNPEHSRAAAEMLGTDALRGRAFTEVLGLTGEREDKGTELVEFLDLLRLELVPEETVAGLNPLEELHFEAGGAARWLRLRYFLIRRGSDLPNHILAVLEDITEEKRLAAQVATSQRENLQLRAIAEDPDLFREFLSETRRILTEVEGLAARLDATEASRPLVAEIFRGVHTIKGVAGSFGLGDLSALASELETSLDHLRKADEIPQDGVDQTRTSLAHLSDAFSEVVEGAKKLLGDDVAGGGLFLRISSEELLRHMVEIRSLTLDDGVKEAVLSRIKEEVLRRLRALREVPARRGLARSLKILPGLLERLGKPVAFRFEGEDTPVDCDVVQELNTSLIHLIRNAVDHGIEPADERVEAGKPEEGAVSLAVSRQDGDVVVTLADDGRGLDPQKLKAAALRKGILDPAECGRLSAEEALGLIFRPGFSTAEQVTDVSGRGVGMDAVLDSIRQKLGGDIRVASSPGEGTRFTITVPASLQTG
ncbi:MAG: Hpt domain-containing protein [Deltaproteobacteria bacterium]|nr:Hpt domain-containing protein [Deltaproteobacteria bacterium]